MNFNIIFICCILLLRVVTVVESGKRGRQGRSRGQGPRGVLVGGKDQSPRAQIDLQHQYLDGLQAVVLKRQDEGPDVEATREDSADGGRLLGELGALGGHLRQHGVQGGLGELGAQGGHLRQHGVQGGLGKLGAEGGHLRQYGVQGGLGELGAQGGHLRQHGVQGGLGKLGAEGGHLRQHGVQGGLGELGAQGGHLRQHGVQGGLGELGAEGGHLRQHGVQGGLGELGAQGGHLRQYGVQGGHLRQHGVQGGHLRQHDDKDLAHPRQDSVELSHGALKDQLQNLQVLLEESRRQEHHSREVYKEMEHLHQECSLVIPEVGVLFQKEHSKTEELRDLADAKALELEALQNTHRSLKREHGKANAKVKEWDQKTYDQVQARNQVVHKHNILQEELERQVKAHKDLVKSFRKVSKERKALRKHYEKKLRRNNNRVEQRNKHRSLNGEMLEQVKDLENKLGEKHSQYETLRGAHNELKNELENLRRIVKEGKKEGFKLAESRRQALHRYNSLAKEHKKERKVYDKASRKYESLRHDNYIREVSLDNLQAMLDEKVGEVEEHLQRLQILEERYNEKNELLDDHRVREHKWLQGSSKFKQEAIDLNSQLKRYQSLTEERERELDRLHTTLTQKDEEIEFLTRKVEATRLSVADTRQEHSECQQQYEHINLKYRRALNRNDYLKSSPH
ncbi:golgin subfamily A member 6-like protein 7 isoform X1 [Cherax quadricarinatus]|uniref:golgin subfamily A member 6-like protein 7 isoform X1 n=1 Tax=Cherax quadricarinatus TaxID=27406 RepID=UPI00387EC6F2